MLSTVRAVVTIVPALLLASCGDAPATPGAPATPPAAAPAGAPAAPAAAAPPVAAPAPAEGLAAIAGTWVIDIPATRKAAYEATKVEILKTGQQFTEAQINEFLDQGEETLKRAAMENTIKADGTYTGSAVGVQRPITGQITVANGEYTFIPDDQTTVARFKLIDGKLVTQRPRDPAAQFMALVWKRK